MSQLNHSFQEILTSNNATANGLENVSGATIITSEALQGFSMANQFAICANPGGAPVLFSCLAPMFVPTLTNSTSKSNFELTTATATPQTTVSNNVAQLNQQQQQQPQTVQIQLATPINLANNICGTTGNNGAGGGHQTLPSLGLSYINLSSLGAATHGGAIPIQITFNNPNTNQQLQIPASALTGVNQDIHVGQITGATGAQNYQIKYEPETPQQNQVTIATNHHQGTQHLTTGTIITQQGGNGGNPDQSTLLAEQQIQLEQIGENEDGGGGGGDGITDGSGGGGVTTNDTKTSGARKKPRRRIPNKSKNTLLNNGTGGNGGGGGNFEQADQRQHDHKGRPFIYSCPHCPKRFTLNSRLTAHLRCHTGIRPYTCVQCGFSFTQKSYLIRHAAVHTEDRPFTCERCLKTYKHYGSLANHRKLHKKEDKMAEVNALGIDEEILDEEDCETGTNSGPRTGTVSSSIIEDHVGEIINMVASGGGSLSWSTSSRSTNKQSKSNHITQESNNDNNNNHDNVSYLGTGPTTFPNNNTESNNQTSQQQRIYITDIRTHQQQNELTDNSGTNTSNNTILYTTTQPSVVVTSEHLSHHTNNLQHTHYIQAPRQIQQHTPYNTTTAM